MTASTPTPTPNNKTTTTRRVVEKQPSAGRRALKVVGYVWLCFSLLIGAMVFIVAMNNNSPVTVFIVPLIMILVSIPMIRAGRVKTEVFYESKEEGV